MGDTDLFIDLPTAYRVSCQSIHRLVALGDGVFRWQEETITEILIGHLAGVDYTISAPCPECGTAECAEWGSDDPRSLRRSGIRLLTKSQEGGKNGLGADFLLCVENFATGEQARLLIQAKKLRQTNGEMVPANRKDILYPRTGRETQYEQLVGAAEECGAAPYYLFYPEKASAHQVHYIDCATHRTPAGSAAVLVHAHNVARAFGDGSTARAEILLSEGRSLLCLAEGGRGDAEVRDHYSTMAFIRKDQPTYAPSRRSTSTAGFTSVSVSAEKRAIRRRSFPPRDHSAEPHRFETDEILALYLGDWRSDELGAAREGHGWYPGISAERLRESTRMYWPLAVERARRVRYLVAMRRGESLAVYEVVADPIRHSPDNTFEFVVDDVPDDSRLAERIKRRAEENHRKHPPYGRAFGYS